MEIHRNSTRLTLFMIHLFPFKANVSNFPSENIWDGPNVRLHAPDGLSPRRRQTIQVQIHSLLLHIAQHCSTVTYQYLHVINLFGKTSKPTLSCSI